MNTTSVPGQRSPNALHNTGGTEWNTALEHLNANEYDPVLKILEQKQKTAELEGNTAQVGLLGAALQICLGCMQHRAEIEQHRQYLTEAIGREKELQRQLGTLLDLAHPPTHPERGVFRNGAQSSAPATHPPSAKTDSLWQRVQSLLGKGAESETTDLPPGSPAGPPAVEPLPSVDDPQPTAEEAVEMTAVADEGPSLTVYCLGSFRVYANGRLVDNWSGNKSKSIFKHMVVHRDRPANHEILMELFWPGEETDLARRSLYQAIYMIRQALQPEEDDFSYIICQNGAYSFNPRLSLWVDSAAFETHYKKGMHLERQGRVAEAVEAYELADSLYEGDFLAEDVYEEWLLVHRERLKHAYMDMLDRLSQYYWTARRFTTCITYCLKILRGDNCREDIHRRLMLAYLHQGQRHLALRQYHRCVEALARELDVEPMPPTEKLYQQIVKNDVQTSTD